MRINQSPNWRALALLGALLSVIIVWPTVLSMPMLTSRTSSSTKSSSNNRSNNITDQQQQQQSPQQLVTLSLSNLTSNFTIITTPNIIHFDNNSSELQQITNDSDYGSYLRQLNVNTNDSDYHDDQDQVDEHLEERDIDPLYAKMTSLNDGEVSNSRRVKKSSMVYNKRKRKKINDNNDNDKLSAENGVSSITTYLSSASISDVSIINSLSKKYINNSVSVSDVNKSDDKVTPPSPIIISHHYQSKRTRNSIKSDTSEHPPDGNNNNNNDDDDNDNNSVIVSTQQTLNSNPTTSISTSRRRLRDYLSTTPATSIDDFEVTSEFWNLDETSVDDNNDTYVTSTIIQSTTEQLKTKTTTLTTHIDYPVLSRTDRSVHTKSGGGSISERHRGSSRNNGGSAAEGDVGGSIKSRRLNNHNKNHNYRNNNHTNSNSSNLDRNERSTISHISGPGRKIQLYIKNRFIQLMTDGTVNGTQDDLSDYTILQRTTVDVGRIKIQGVATCLYLCMDQCGAVYGSKEFTDDCVFNESMEQHNYNTYSSTYNSNSRRIFYLALNRHGEPRKLQIPPSRSLGKLATYTKAITETVPQDRVETLIAKKFGANRVKHGIRQLCDTGKPLVELTDKILKARPQCTATNSNSNSNSNSNKNGQLNVPAANDKSRLSILTNSSSNSNSTSSSSNSNSSSNGHTSGNSNNNHVIKKKKKKRRCRPGENEDEHNCQRGGPQAIKKRPANNNNNNNNNKMAKCKDATPETAIECANQKRPKKGGGKKHNAGGGGGGGPKHNGAKQNGGGGGGPVSADGRRGGKKLNQNGRQQQGGNNSNKKINGKQPKNGLGGGGRTTTTTTTTVHPITNNKVARTPRSRSIPSATAKTTTTTTTTTAATSSTSTTTTTAVNNHQLHQTSAETQDADESGAEDTSAEEETEDDDTANDDDISSSHLPFIGEHTQLVGGADDFLYDDDLDL